MADSVDDKLNELKTRAKQIAKIERRHNVVDIIMTAAFVVFFLGNMTAQVFYICFW